MLIDDGGRRAIVCGPELAVTGRRVWHFIVSLTAARDVTSSLRANAQWRINHEAMEARASGPQFLGQKIGPAFRLSSNI